MNNRWYDRHENTTKVFELLKSLNERTQNVISEDISLVSNSIKTIRKEQEEIPLSIGENRVLGLYMASQKRRWYDKNSDLKAAIQTISTLSEEDYVNIMDGLYLSLNQ